MPRYGRRFALSATAEEFMAPERRHWQCQPFSALPSIDAVFSTQPRSPARHPTSLKHDIRTSPHLPLLQYVEAATPQPASLLHVACHRPSGSKDADHQRSPPPTVTPDPCISLTAFREQQNENVWHIRHKNARRHRVFQFSTYLVNNTVYITGIHY